jgi:hypothetical protein
MAGTFGRIREVWLQASIATLEPYLEPRRETMCLLLPNVSRIDAVGKLRRNDIPDMGRNALVQLTLGVEQNPLDKIVAKLISRD